MNPGLMRTRGWLQRATGEQDALGQPIAGTWSNVALVSADVRFLSGLEVIRADAQTSVVKASVRIRVRTDVTVGMRYLVGATDYRIVSAPPPGSRRDFMDLACEVVT